MLCACRVVGSAQDARSYDDRPRISVSGDATVNATPDKIVIQFGVETQDKNMLGAKQKSNDILKRVFAALKTCGVKERDIQTEYLYAEPRWAEVPPAPPYSPSAPPTLPASPSDRDLAESRRFLGYFVKNVVAVTVKDAAKIDKLIGDLLAAGATHIYGVEFQTSDLKTYREKARELALKAAKEKAVKMAAVLGQSVGAPIEIAEGGGGPFNNNDPSGAQTLGSSYLPTAGTTNTIALGKIAIFATVNVTFELKPAYGHPHPRPLSQRARGDGSRTRSHDGPASITSPASRLSGRTVPESWRRPVCGPHRRRPPRRAIASTCRRPPRQPRDWRRSCD